MATNANQQPHSGRGIWLVAALLVHLSLWLGLVIYLCGYVPAQGRVYEDFGLELPVAVELLLSVSSAVRQTWFVIVPLLIVGIVVFDVCICLLIRSVAVRSICLVALVFLPILCFAVWHLLLWNTTQTLIHQLS